ncbi:MAG TPA: hypothetical protein VKT80_07020 [Chloroflexota bacterium]|nr:hypothetical protein [Chloroflexota bacterium]
MICTGNNSPFEYRHTLSDPSPNLPTIDKVAANAGRRLTDKMTHVGGRLGRLALCGLALVTGSFVAKGGIIEATIDLARNQPTSLGRAWRTERHYFWRFVGLTLVPVIIAMMLGVPGG